MEKAEQEDAHVLNSYKVTIKIQGGTSMNKGNIIGLGVMAVAAAAVVAVSGPAYEAIQSSRLKAAADGAEITVVNGEAEGFGGPVQAEVTVAGDKIIALSLTGEGETPEIGGTAMEERASAILEKGTVEGVDAVSGATVTSEGGFAAVKAAVEAEAVEEETKAVAVEGALTGTAKGFGGEIQAQVVVDESGVITDLLLMGDGETPEIGGTAMEELTSAILEKGTVEGVDAVSGATVTSEGVFAAVKAALEQK